MPIEITMPALSPTMTEGTLAKWLKKEGEAVASGDIIAEIETDKATMEVEAVDEGTLGKIVVAAGTENVPVNDVIALLLEEGEDKKALEKWKPKQKEAPKEAGVGTGDQGSEAKDKGSVSAPAPAAVAPQASKAPAAPIKQQTKGMAQSGDRAKASPLAKRLAAEAMVDLARVVGTGPHGRIIRADIEEAKLRGGGGGGAAKRHPTEMVQIPNNGMRKTIARRLLEAKQQMPHFYLTVECEIDALLEVRKQINGEAGARAPKDAKPAYRISVNDLVIKAAALALRDKPECNVSWYDDAMIQYNNVDVSIAVATDGGLITPIIRNADQKSLPQISNEMKALAARAREGALKPEEYQGGGFSVSNLGMFGVQEFAAIINPPQSCILAVGAGEEKVVRRNGEFCVVNVMKATLSVDHRAVDGALGAQWLQLFKKYIEHPVLMFV